MAERSSAPVSNASLPRSCATIDGKLAVLLSARVRTGSSVQCWGTSNYDTVNPSDSRIGDGWC